MTAASDDRPDWQEPPEDEPCFDGAEAAKPPVNAFPWVLVTRADRRQALATLPLAALLELIA
jgi:hypothetical protein